MKKLIGRIILNTRPSERAIPLVQAIENEGGRCLTLPSFSVAPVPIASELFDLYLNSNIWLFMSQYAVKYALPLLLKNTNAKKLPLIGAVGKATAAALQEAGIPVKWIPEDFSSEGLLNIPEFQHQQLDGLKVTIFCGKSGRKLLDESMVQRGAVVQECIIYERIPAVWTKENHVEINKYLQQSEQFHIDLGLGMSVDSLRCFFAQADMSLAQRKLFLDIPWLVMSSRVAEHAKKLGIQKIYIVSSGDIFESLILFFSSGIIQLNS